MQALVREVPSPARAGLRGAPPAGHAPDARRSLDMVKRFVKFGASPRGAQALLLAAKIRALFEGRFAPRSTTCARSRCPALRHRVLLNFEGEAEGVKTDDVLARS
jgi:MoxR-like ATPase